MSLKINGHSILDWGFPRVSGDEPMPRDGFASEVEFSPRERG